jgi:hypothetical protein
MELRGRRRDILIALEGEGHLFLCAAYAGRATLFFATMRQVRTRRTWREVVGLDGRDTIEQEFERSKLSESVSPA